MSPCMAAASLAHGRRLVAAPRARTEWRRDLVVRSRTQITAAVWSWTGSVVQLAPRWLRVVVAVTLVVASAAGEVAPRGGVVVTPQQGRQWLGGVAKRPGYGGGSGGPRPAMADQRGCAAGQGGARREGEEMERRRLKRGTSRAGGTGGY